MAAARAVAFCRGRGRLAGLQVQEYLEEACFHPPPDLDEDMGNPPSGVASGRRTPATATEPERAARSAQRTRRSRSRANSEARKQPQSRASQREAGSASMRSGSAAGRERERDREGTTKGAVAAAAAAAEVEHAEDLCGPGYEYDFLAETVDPPLLHSQIPAGYVGRQSEVDPMRADAAPWLDKLPVIREFRRRGL